jgi:hypothetical protein
MKTLIVQCDNLELEHQLVDVIVKHFTGLGFESQVESFGGNTTHSIIAKPYAAPEELPDVRQDAPTAVELLPEPPVEPVVAPVKVPPEPSSEVTPAEVPPVELPADPFQSTCKLWDLSSHSQVPCLHNPFTKASLLCVTHCEVVGDYVTFTYAGMTHKVPRASSYDACCNKDAILTASSICVSLSIADGAICRCLLSVTCDEGEERVLIGSDLDHLIQTTEVETTNGTVSTQ